MMRKKRHDAVEWSCCGFSSKNNLRISAINFYCAIFQDLFSVLPLLMHFFSPSGWLLDANYWNPEFLNRRRRREQLCGWNISLSRGIFYFTVAGSHCTLFRWDMCAHERSEEQIKAPLNFLLNWNVAGLSIWGWDIFAKFVPMADVSIVQCYSRELSTG